MAFDLRYPHFEVDVAAIRKSAENLARKNPPAQSASASGSMQPAAVHFGIQVRAVTDADIASLGLSRAQRILVVAVEKGSLAQTMGIQPADVILGVNNSEMSGLPIFKAALSSGAVKTFHLWRKGKTIDAVVPESL